MFYRIDWLVGSWRMEVHDPAVDQLGLDRHLQYRRRVLVTNDGNPVKHQNKLDRLSYTKISFRTFKHVSYLLQIHVSRGTHARY